MGRQGPLSIWLGAALASLSGCGQRTQELPPYAEVLVEVDTNLRAPQTMSRVRFDVFDSEQRWLTTRDVPAPNPADFPLSFSIYTDSEQAQTAWLRVRGYLEGRLRDYQGERFTERPEFEPPSASQSLSEACRDAAPVTLGQARNLRLRSRPFGAGGVTCTASSGDSIKHTQSGLAVFRISIAEPAVYHLAVTGAVPGVDWASVADPLLSLRSDCEAASSELACNDDEQPELGNAPGLRTRLEPGDYFALIGNVAENPMDVTLLLEEEQPPAEVPQLGGSSLEAATPRLVVDGVDETPPSEPDPHLAVDRLVELELEPARQRTARVLLDGECLGTMADLAEGRSCVDRESVLVAALPEPLSEGKLPRAASAVGTWSKYESAPCPERELPPPNPERYDERLCLPGGSFLLGDPTLIARGADSGSPERFATIPTFAMDRYEYTVGRYRAARARGFEPPDAGPLNNFAALELDARELTRACTWNEALDGSSGFPERESLPLSCVSWLTADALCRFEGGSLPSVAEREFAASAAERELETSFPWGDQAPDCDTAVFGRWLEPSHGSSSCYDAKQLGPRPVDAKPWADFDRTPSGVVGLGGNVAEWTLDSHRAYSDACWQSQGQVSPECDEPEAPLRTVAGGSWRSPAAGTRAALRVGGAVAGVDPWVGLRCVYAVGPP